MTIIIVAENQLFADSVVTNANHVTKLERGKTYVVGKNGSVAFAGFGPDHHIVKALRSGKGLFDALINWANASDSNQFVYRPNDKEDFYVALGDPGKRIAVVVEPGDTVAIGMYRDQWYQFAAAHGWTAANAVKFIALVEQLHGF